jgi:N utilization substance protein B
MQGTLSLGSVSDVLHRNLTDFSNGDADVPFAEALLINVMAKKDELDAVIVKAAPEWPLDKIAPVDRNVLRIGLYELLFGDRMEVPPKVALNEAIELGKSFGGDSSGKFVNGVLGTVYRDIGEPGKKEEKKEPAPIPHESLGGAVVAVREGESVWIALVKDAFDKWTLPKSRCEENELADSAAKRAIADELGIEVAVKIPLGEHEYIAHEPEEGRVARTVGYFLVLIPNKITLTPPESSGILDAQWFSEEEIAKLDTYGDLSPVLQSGITEAKRV